MILLSNGSIDAKNQMQRRTLTLLIATNDFPLNFGFEAVDRKMPASNASLYRTPLDIRLERTAAKKSSNNSVFCAVVIGSLLTIFCGSPLQPHVQWRPVQGGAGGGHLPTNGFQTKVQWEPQRQKLQQWQRRKSISYKESNAKPDGKCNKVINAIIIILIINIVVAKQATVCTYSYIYVHIAAYMILY